MKTEKDIQETKVNFGIEPLMTAYDIAAILQVGHRQVSEVYAMMPSFPKAIRLPSPRGEGHYRWKKEEILKWIDGLTDKY